MDECMDLFDLIKGHNKHAKIITQSDVHHHDIEDDSLDLDKDSEISEQGT